MENYGIKKRKQINFSFGTDTLPLTSKYSIEITDLEYINLLRTKITESNIGYNFIFRKKKMVIK